MRTHPWHPPLVHFPIACLTLATLTDLSSLHPSVPTAVAAALPGLEAEMLARALLWLGLALGVPTAALGIVDLLRLPAQLQRRADVTWHVLSMLGAWFLFLVAALLRAAPGALTSPVPWGALSLEVTGLVGMVIGGRLAGAIVFGAWPPPAGGR